MRLPLAYAHAALAVRQSAIETAYLGPVSGKGTPYGMNGSGGTCMLAPRADSMFVAWPAAAWESALYCGACLRVTGDKGSTYVQITNQYPEGRPGDLDFSDKAFDSIITGSSSGGSVSGEGPVSFMFVSCKDAGLESGDLEYYWKTGTGPTWASIQVRGAALPVRTLEVQQPGSQDWIALQRQEYNYFEQRDLGPGPFQVRVTYHDGSVSPVSEVALNHQMGEG